MKLKHCTPVLFVKDARISRDFYADVLGMTVTADFGGLNFSFKEGFAIWQPMPENIIPRTLGAKQICNPLSVSRFELCFETENLDKVYLALKQYGVKFLHEINEEQWGQRTVRFYDPDGHLVEVGETLPVFVKRIYKEEKTVEGVARRTYLDIKLVYKILKL